MVRVLAESRGEGASQRAAEVERNPDSEDRYTNNREELQDVTHYGTS
jgi:hypothetical protein